MGLNMSKGHVVASQGGTAMKAAEWWEKHKSSSGMDVTSMIGLLQNMQRWQLLMTDAKAELEGTGMLEVFNATFGEDETKVKKAADEIMQALKVKGYGQ